jgi:ribosome-associated toxin RatA of RatAB toxin-antitoxin module
MSVRTENSILIRAPLDEVFQATSNLQFWPRVLPHYRWIRVVETDGNGVIVKMAARRGWLPIQWTSRFHADPNVPELRFEHLKAFTRGMKVRWTYTPTPDGVLVRISHELERGSVFGRWFAHRVLGDMFIKPIATRTLVHFKHYLEQDNDGTLVT